MALTGKSWIARDIGKLRAKTREQRLSRSDGLTIRTGITGTTVNVRKGKGGPGGNGAVWL
jgi:hypothetical protein